MKENNESLQYKNPEGKRKKENAEKKGERENLLLRIILVNKNATRQH